MLDNAQVAKDKGHNVWIHTVNDFKGFMAGDRKDNQLPNAYEQLERTLTAKYEVATTNFKAGKALFALHTPKHYTVCVVFGGYPTAYYDDGDCFSVVGKDGLRKCSLPIPLPAKDMSEGWFDTRKEGNRLLFVLCSVESMDYVNAKYVLKMKAIAEQHSVPFHMCRESKWKEFVEAKTNELQ